MIRIPCVTITMKAGNTAAMGMVGHADIDRV